MDRNSPNGFIKRVEGVLRGGNSVSRRSFIRSLAVGVPALVCGAGIADAGIEPVSMGEKPPFESLFPGINVISRSDWAWLTPKSWRLNRSNGFDRITVHHEGTYPHETTDPDSVARHLNSIVAAHQKRAFGDIGYHYIVDFAGRIWEGRSTGYEGAHVSMENEGNLGVMLLGNFDEQEPSAAQISAMHMTLIVLMHEYGIGAGSVFGHCDLGASACPGRYLYEPHVHKFREMA